MIRRSAWIAAVVWFVALNGGLLAAPLPVKDAELLKAAQEGNLPAVKRLLSQGASINAAEPSLSHKGWTALHFATFHGHRAVAEFLISKGADRMSKTRAGLSVMYTACVGGLLELCKELVTKTGVTSEENMADWTPLHGAAAGGHLEIVRFLIEKGADVNAVDNAKSAPLHWVAFHGAGERALAVAKLLLEKGARVNAFDMLNKTPLDHAAGKEPLSKLLREAGAKFGKDMPVPAEKKG